MKPLLSALRWFFSPFKKNWLSDLEGFFSWPMLPWTCFCYPYTVGRVCNLHHLVLVLLWRVKGKKNMEVQGCKGSEGRATAKGWWYAGWTRRIKLVSGRPSEPYKETSSYSFRMSKSPKVSERCWISHTVLRTGAQNFLNGYIWYIFTVCDIQYKILYKDIMYNIINKCI